MKPELRSILTSFLPGILFAIILGAVRFYEVSTNQHLLQFGLFPRSTEDLTGILTFPFIHRDNEHLFSNIIPLFILSAMLFYFYREFAWRVIFFTWILSGFWLWLGGRPSAHIGASGMVYAISSFLFFSGAWRKERRMMAVSLIIVFLYGGMVWGIFPLFKDMSWEGHLFGGLAGLLMSWIYRKKGPQRVKYEWEEDGYDEAHPIPEEAFSADLTEDPSPAPTPQPINPILGSIPSIPAIRYEYVDKNEQQNDPEQKNPDSDK